MLDSSWLSHCSLLGRLKLYFTWRISSKVNESISQWVVKRETNELILQTPYPAIWWRFLPRCSHLRLPHLRLLCPVSYGWWHLLNAFCWDVKDTLHRALQQECRATEACQKCGRQIHSALQISFPGTKDASSDSTCDSVIPSCVGADHMNPGGEPGATGHWVLVWNNAGVQQRPEGPRSGGPNCASLGSSNRHCKLKLDEGEWVRKHYIATLVHLSCIKSLSWREVLHCG